MPAYNNTPFKPAPKLLIAGWPEYLLGSFNFDVPWGKVAITSASAGTLTGVIVEGNIPAVGDLISTQGTSADVTSTPITGVVANAATGVVTLTYSGGGTSTGGTAKIVPLETAAAITTLLTTAPVTVPFQDTRDSHGRTITVIVKTVTSTSLVGTFSLQGAMEDLDSEYVAIPTVNYTGSTGTIASTVALSGTAGASVSAQYADTLYRFYRVLFTVTGGSGTGIAKIMA